MKAFAGNTTQHCPLESVLHAPQMRMRPLCLTRLPPCCFSSFWFQKRLWVQKLPWNEMSSPQEECPEFFKVCLPECSSDKLALWTLFDDGLCLLYDFCVLIDRLIPTAFREHFNGFVPHKAILRDPVGRVWQVELSKIGKDVYFQKGWQKFVTDNFVEMEDFLVFRYDGGYIFDFKLFRNTGCEKKGSEEINVGIYKRCFCVNEEKDVEEEKSNEEEEDSAEEERDSTEDESSEKEEEGGEMSEEEEEPQPKSSKKKGVVYKRKYSGRVGYKQTAIKKSRVASEESNCTKRKYKEASAVQVEENIAFEIERDPIWTRSHLDAVPVLPITEYLGWACEVVYVPLDVLRDHNIKLPPKMTLRDPLGRLWIGKVAVWKDGRTWIGWKPFCKWNNVGENDTCICEFVQESGHEGYLLVVHILRHSLAGGHPNANAELKVVKRWLSQVKPTYVCQ
ncbi:putative B3 domain-containing protein [Vitis vinifera]|uniref:Putative B3 domain-containing protein n=1 Tax=Vitis vinifera TaxID=29760 RepID=A0A438FM70_VITVI|nr:putative B3 domain-containing protein [Vitis vinifera]